VGLDWITGIEYLIFGFLALGLWASVVNNTEEGERL
jgi:hypothetical protein